MQIRERARPRHPMDEPVSIYKAILKGYLEGDGEASLYRAAQLGRQLLQREVPPESLVEMHFDALDSLAHRLAPPKQAAMLQRSSAVIIETMIAHSLAFREQADFRERMLANLHRSFISTTKALAAAVEAKDTYTRGHSERVSECGVAMAEEMGLPQSDVEGIRIAGILHDVGKLGIPTEILERPRRLTQEEFALVKTHVEISSRIIEEVDFPWEVKPMVAQHHERYNGEGYPAGLKGEEIVLGGRILGLADVFEALSSDRPYRSGLPTATAIEMIQGGAGTDFDPQVVEVFLRLLRREDKGFLRKGDSSLPHFWERRRPQAQSLPSPFPPRR